MITKYPLLVILRGLSIGWFVLLLAPATAVIASCILSIYGVNCFVFFSALRSFELDTMFIAFVICFIFLVDFIRVSISLREATISPPYTKLVYYSDLLKLFLNSLIAVSNFSASGKPPVSLISFNSSVAFDSAQWFNSSSKRVISTTGISSKYPFVNA